MTPVARIQAAIDILDQIFAGARAEPALRNWGRANRYAGSGDRAAIRDHVYQVIRRRASCAWMGGGSTGRAAMLGLARQCDWDLDALFSGARHAPGLLTDAERKARDLRNAESSVQLDWPAWLLPEIAHLQDKRDAVCAIMRDRAPVFLRVNTLKADRDTAIAALADVGMRAEPHDLSPTAFLVTENARRVGQSDAYRAGLVELQDAASQAVVDFCNVERGERILDYCAGGGGKTLALAAKSRATVTVHDANRSRMRDLPERSRRAGADIEFLSDDGDRKGAYDLVLCDVPCSGSGSWRRDPEGKWALTAEDLNARRKDQIDILVKAAALVAEGGRLAYMTCSILECENQKQIEQFTQQAGGWTCQSSRQFLPTEGGDGFFVAILTR